MESIGGSWALLWVRKEPNTGLRKHEIFGQGPTMTDHVIISFKLLHLLNELNDLSRLPDL